MKIWTYAEVLAKIEVDFDLKDEIFIDPQEMIGYVNEGIEEAESEILKIDEEYFLTSYPIPLVIGQASYLFPTNGYAFKGRGIVYQNGSIIYPVKRFPRKDKFLNVACASQFGQADDYQWYFQNASPGNAVITLVPPARETAIVPPNANPFTPMIYNYIRHANRVPLLGEYILKYDQVVQSTAINTGTGTITINQTYVTGDQVMFTTTGTIPGGIVVGTIYYAIVSGGTIQLASTLANALANTPLSITTQGSGVLSIAIAANQTIINNTLVDIPEFTKFVIAFAKCCIMMKEGDPRYDSQKEERERQRAQMVSTLTEAQQDDENQIIGDLSAYTEMS